MTDQKGGRARKGTVITLADGRRQGIVTLPNGGRHRLTPFPEKWSDAKCEETTAYYSENPKPEWLLAAPQKRARKLPKNATGGEAWWADFFEHREGTGLTPVAGMYKAHILPILGDKHPRQWSSADCEAVRDALDAKIKAGFWESTAGEGKVRRYPFGWKRAWNVWAVFTSACKAASRSKNKALRVRPDNPCVGLEPPDRGFSKKTQWLRPSEFLALVNCTEIPERWRDLYILLTYTYLRPNELAALLWKDVDLDVGLIHVTKAWDFDAGEPKPYTKTGAGIRDVQIEPTLAPVLKRLRKGTKAADRVVPSMPPTEDWAATLRVHLKRAGVKRDALFDNSKTVRQITLYGLRHTGITWRTIRGDDARVIQRHAGHEKYATTEGYVHEAEDYRGKLGLVFPPLSPDQAPAGFGANDQESIRGGKTIRKYGRNSVPKGIRTCSKLRVYRGFYKFSKAKQGAILAVPEANPATLELRSIERSIPPTLTDPIELALAEAITKAATAGAFDALPALVAELAARRGARSR